MVLLYNSALAKGAFLRGKTKCFLRAPEPLQVISRETESRGCQGYLADEVQTRTCSFLRELTWSRYGGRIPALPSQRLLPTPPHCSKANPCVQGLSR